MSKPSESEPPTGEAETNDKPGQVRSKGGRPRKARIPTSTRSFGSSTRESHDATAFYARFVAPVVSDDETIHPDKALDRLICGDARSMDDVADNSVALVVTSPPYFAGKEYEAVLGMGGVPASYLEYLQMLEAVFADCVRVLEPGGRIAVNVANLGRKPYRSLSGDVTAILQDRLGLLLRGEVIWRKAEGASGNCAWGSFQRPANPVMRDLTERVIIASKGRFDRAIKPDKREALGLPHVASLTRDEFMEATTDVWEIAPESATRVGHPAPFPIALPERLIHLHTYVGDLVLDPFLGSGTTAVAAVRTGRHYVGYDTDPGYVAASQARVEGERHQATQPQFPGFEGSDSFDQLHAALAAGRSIADVARAALADAGFCDVVADKRLALRGRDARGRTWRFEVVGALTAVRPGVARVSDAYEAVGRAAIARADEPETPIVLLSASIPTKGPIRDVLRRANNRYSGSRTGSADTRPLCDVIDLRSAAGLAELAEHGRGHRG